MLDRDEYVEQAHLFRTISERMEENVPLQELFAQIRHELLSTTRLPMAVDFLLAEIKHLGVMTPAMRRLSHYFTPFQTYVISEAEAERGRFDIRIAIDILRFEAEYRAKTPSLPGLFMFQFECLCRNRLRYDHGLEAIASDSTYDDAWREWLGIVRAQVGLRELAELIYVRSEFYQQRRFGPGDERQPPEKPVLFGEKEGKIAYANRGKDPLYLFAALQRHLAYPAAPRPKKIDTSAQELPLLKVRIERLETRLKLLEEEQGKGIDITKFYGGHSHPPSEPIA